MDGRCGHQPSARRVLRQREFRCVSKKSNRWHFSAIRRHFSPPDRTTSSISQILQNLSLRGGRKCPTGAFARSCNTSWDEQQPARAKRSSSLHPVSALGAQRSLPSQCALEASYILSLPRAFEHVPGCVFHFRGNALGHSQASRVSGARAAKPY